MLERTGVFTEFSTIINPTTGLPFLNNTIPGGRMNLGLSGADEHADAQADDQRNRHQYLRACALYQPGRALFSPHRSPLNDNNSIRCTWLRSVLRARIPTSDLPACRAASPATASTTPIHSRLDAHLLTHPAD